MKKVGIVSLGCMKNRVDSENILGLFDRNGYEITNDPKDSDIIVINTCGYGYDIILFNYFLFNIFTFF